MHSPVVYDVIGCLKLKPFFKRNNIIPGRVNRSVERVTLRKKVM